MTPAEYLQQLENSLHLLPVPCGTWLKAGLRRFRVTNDMTVALGLCRRGAIRTRNIALLRAAHLVAPNERPWTQAGALKLALANFRGEHKKPETLSVMVITVLPLGLVWKGPPAGDCTSRVRAPLVELVAGVP